MLKDNMNNKKLLYFIQLPPPFHGVSIVNNYIWNNKLINRGFEKIILKLSFSSEMKELGKVKIRKIFILFSIMRQLVKVLSSFKPDYIYFSIAPTGKAFLRDLFFVLIIKISGITPIYHIHGKGIADRISNRLLKQVYKYVFNNSVIIHLSKGLLVSEIESLNLTNKKLHFVENGVLDYIEMNAGVKEDHFIHIIFIAVLSESKGIKILLNVAKDLCSLYDNLTFDVIGTFADNDIEEYIKEFINNNNLNSNILLHGYKSGDEKWELISKGDVFFHPTFNDAFPIVLLEAMSCGLPIVSTEVGAIPEMVKNGVNAFISRVGDEGSLKENLENLIKDQALRMNMGKVSKEMYLQKYTKSAFEKRMRAVFSSL